MKHSRILRDEHGSPLGIGDVDPLGYGGGFVYRLLPSSNGSGFELEYIDPPPDEEFDTKGALWTIYRTPLDRCIPNPAKKGAWVNASLLDRPLPCPLGTYSEWWGDDVQAMVACMDHSTFAQDMASEDPLLRARAYQTIGQYHGWENLDSYPLMLTRAEVTKRYRHAWRSRKLEQYRRTGR